MTITDTTSASSQNEFQVDSFMNVFDRRVSEEGRSGRQVADSLGSVLKSEFEDAARRRQPYEERWLKDIRQAKDIYEPDVKSELNKNVNRSQTFIPKTRTKKSALGARLLELFFPANGEQNWDIQPTPEPSVPPDRIEEMASEITESGEDYRQYSRRSLSRMAADRSCQAMRDEMRDQLVNRFGRPSYREVISDVVDQGLTLGTGVLKGPLVDYAQRESWIFLESDSRWEIRGNVQRERTPFKEYVSLWDCYPDMDATNIRDCRFHWQTHLMTMAELEELASMPYFDSQAIREYIRDHPEGDAQLRNHEVNLRSLSDSTQPPSLKNRYRVLERWGYLKGHDLARAGVDVPEEAMEREFPANCWILGYRVIKAVREPVRGVVIPYHYWYFSKDESSIFGDGVPYVLRDSQSSLNSTVRAMLDNSAISSGPQVGVNVSALQPGTDWRQIGAWGVWPFESAEDMQKAMQVWDLPNHINNYLALVQYLTNLMDEITTPRFMQGDGQVSGAGRTAHGLSMLMGAAHVVLKDLVRQFDDRITRPFIIALYHWNMQFNEREDIKGDYQVQATGSTSLVAKEIQTEKLLQVAQITENPRFAGRLKDDELLEEIFRSMDVKTSLVRDDQEYEAWREQQIMREARAKAKANLEVLLDEAQGRGLDTNQVLERLLAQQASQFQQAGQTAEQPEQPGGFQAPGPEQLAPEQLSQMNLSQNANV